MNSVLIVEDEMVVSTQLTEVLPQLGYTVAGTTSKGTEAIKLAKKHRPEIVLMDLVLSDEMDGIEIAERIKEEVDCSILFLAAHTEGGMAQRAKRIAPSGYLLKPFRADQVKVALELALHNRALEKKLVESEVNFRSLAENAKDAIVVVSDDGQYQFANIRASEITGYDNEELLRMKITDLVHPKQAEKIYKRYRSRLHGRRALGRYETLLMSKQGMPIPVETTASKTIWQGKPAVMAIMRDISDRKRMETELREARERLEFRVRERTRDLDMRTRSLEEVNTAMKVMVKKREEDRKELEEKVLINVQHIAAPYLKKLKRTRLDSEQIALVKIIESNLRDIVSPFSQTLSSKYFHLTPKEIHVANLIKQGKSTKEIGTVLSMSVKTVESHRKSIRKKLGLTNRRTNLRSYLMSLP